jgi:tetrapyrrole methylase family protein / MazG family protein
MSYGGSITIVGLGPGNLDLRTIGTQRALDAADAIVLRTRVHPGLDDMRYDPRVTDCDDLYRGSANFDDLYPAIAQRVIDLAAAGKKVVFAVPGHPRVAERSVALVLELAAERSVPAHNLDAVSFIDTVISAVSLDPVASGLAIFDAEQLAETLDAAPFSAGQIAVDPTKPLLVAQLYKTDLAEAVKLALGRIYPDDHAVVIVRGAGMASSDATHQIALHELDRQRPDHLTSLYVPPLADLDAARSAATLARITARLRAPGGCPWDREQSHRSLRNAVIEEAYEVVDAIDQGDADALHEELGDLLLLVAMHAQIAEEAGDFSIEDVYEAINRKLVRRHPHVFAADSADTPGAVVATWERVKAEERASKTKPAPTSKFDRLPRAMPAVQKAIELFAPTAEFGLPREPDAGDAALDAILALIEAGIDPEQAINAAIAQRYERRNDPSRAATTADGSRRKSA